MPASEAIPIIDAMVEHKWAPPEHQDVPIYASESLPLDQVGDSSAADPPEPVWIDRLRFDQIGGLEQVKAFAVARSDARVRRDRVARTAEAGLDAACVGKQAQARAAAELMA